MFSLDCLHILSRQYDTYIQYIPHIHYLVYFCIVATLDKISYVIHSTPIHSILCFLIRTVES